LLDLLERLRVELEGKQSETFKRLRVIIIDSLGSLLGAVLGGQQGTFGHSMMMNVSRIMKSMASEYNIAFVVRNINNLTDIVSIQTIQ
jgi:hypothetical protein